MQQQATGEIALLSRRDTMISMLIIGVLFFIFGFVSWINAILIPYFKIACELSNFQSYLVAFAFYISYLVISVPSSFLLKKIGFKKGIMIGFWIMAAGAFIFLPAAYFRTYWIFLVGLFSLGAGLAVLQTAANPYITILGPIEKATQRFSIMGICNKGAGIIAPIIFAAIILRSTDTELFKSIPLMADAERAQVLDQLIRRVVVPYTIVGIVLFLLGVMVRYSPLPEIDTEKESATVAEQNAGKTSIFQFPYLILGAIAIFVHVGTQVIAIDTIIGYAGSMGLTLLEAKTFPSYTLFATITGYFIGIWIVPRFVSQLAAFRFCVILGLVLTCFIVLTHGKVNILGHETDISIWFVVLLGLANSLVWPGIWSQALRELGRFTKLGGSIMVMGLCGNAILPLLYGYFADKFHVRDAYWVLAPCYAYLIFYAFRGYRLKKWNFKQTNDQAQYAEA